MASYRKDLKCNPEGFSLYYNHMSSAIDSYKDVSSYLMRWAQIEAQYAKSLSELNKSRKGMKKFDKEVGTIVKCIDLINDQLESIAKRHEEISSKLSRETCPMFENHAKEVEKSAKKKTTKVGEGLTKDFNTALKSLEKAKSSYYKACKEADQAAEKYMAKTNDPAENANQKVVAKMKKEAKEKKDKADKAQQEYQKQLEAANSLQQRFYATDMPALVDQFQDFDRERLQLFKKAFEEAIPPLLELPGALEPIVSSIKASVSAIDPEADMVAFVESNRAVAVSDAPDIPYEPYQSDGAAGSAMLDLSDDPSASSSGISAPTPSVISSPSASALPAVAAGGAAAGRPKAGDIGTYKEKVASDPEKDFPGLTDADAGLASDAKVAKLKEQLERCQTELEQQQKARQGIEQLMKMYASQPGQMDSLKSGLSDQDALIARITDREKVLVAQLKELGVEGEELFEEVEVVYVTALYDYTATNDTELSFKMGETIMVTDMDDSGWWYGELKDGKAGYVPKNYLNLADKK